MKFNESLMQSRSCSQFPNPNQVRLYRTNKWSSNERREMWSGHGNDLRTPGADSIDRLYWFW